MKSNETPKGRIVSALRMLWLRSRERAAALRKDDYTCQKCNIRASYTKDNPVKVEVNHKAGITNWDKIVEIIRKELLCGVEHLEVLCKECHKKETKRQNS